MRWKILLTISLLFIKVFAKYQNIIDVDDILSADFMPGSLLMLENPEKSVKSFENGTNDFIFEQTGINGTFDYALDTMEYHRSMMNEYLCRNFIAEQIMEDMSITRLKRRLGGPEPRISTPQKVTLRENLIEDEGSSNYKNWLQKSTTLEDIYKHYQQMEKRDDDYDKDLDPDHESYDTHAVNYGYPPSPPIGPAKLGHTAGGGIIYPSGAAYGYGGVPPTVSYSHTGHSAPSGHTGYTGHSGYGYSGPSVSQHGYDDVSHIHIHHDSPPLYQGSNEEKGGKDLGELFEIALTALAYLSFGMFVVHVVVCISQAKKQEVYYMPIVTMTSTSSTTLGTVGMPGNMGMSLNGDDAGVMGQPNMANGDGEMMGDGDGGDMMMTGEGGMMNGEDMGGNGNDMMGDNGDDMMGGNGDDMMGGNGDDMMGGDGDYMMGDDNGGDGGDGDGENREGRDGSTGGGFRSKFKKRTNELYRTAAPTTTTMMMMMTGKKRKKREAPVKKHDIPTISNPNTVALNELAKHILTSIEAALVAHQDDGSCLRKMLCENNKYSRSLDNSNKIWIPVWSLGMSWLSGKLTKGIPPATSMLDSLKASILGLGKANCKVLYQECDLQRERLRRRRRRKK